MKTNSYNFKKKIDAVVLATIWLAAIFGLWGSGGISVAHWSGEKPCPTINLFPACYVIFLGYGLILLSTYPHLKKSLLVFLIGWVPVMILALIGVIGELTSTLHCPQSEAGMPKCYFSAALGIIIGFLYWHFYRVKLSKW